ncbi:MAG: response regulator [Candidatus Eisenbacteria bacterium]|uniref:Response regulator n=1 Tax=Eiseniibacteriota bacterium TaxID=2212470 RepID=A0A948RUE6_UNCEI|nr:response regulator [Candidatus Eisenbacteria bacterium]MBU1949404.1 response regulator [Candidatus Eisenbacteria bacterium]MBU2691203.1 response regulator [Candidatus Eisenbacteria bacterium]
MARLLILDDNTELLETFKELLELHGYDIVTCPSGLQGLLLLGYEKPDLLILDLQLKDSEGFQIFRILRADPRSADLPVLFVSGVFLEKEVKIKDLAPEGGGPTAFLSKPVAEEVLIAEVERLLALSRRMNSAA